MDKVQLVSGLQGLLVLGVTHLEYPFVQIQLHMKKVLPQQPLLKNLLVKQIYLLQTHLRLVLEI